jgi:uncharacterized membrane protein YqhA
MSDEVPPAPVAAPPATGQQSFIEGLLGRSLLIVVVGVIGLAVTAALSFGWGIAKTYDFARLLFEDGADSDLAVVQVLEIIDTFLLATVLVILAVGLYDLFVADIPAPSWLVFKDLASLKSKVSDVIVLLLAIKFLEKSITSKEPLDLVWYSISIALVGGLLIVFRQWKSS